MIGDIDVHIWDMRYMCKVLCYNLHLQLVQTMVHAQVPGYVHRAFIHIYIYIYKKFVCGIYSIYIYIPIYHDHGIPWYIYMCVPWSYVSSLCAHGR